MEGKDVTLIRTWSAGTAAPLCNHTRGFKNVGKDRVVAPQRIFIPAIIWSMSPCAAVSVGR
jgi:hypothetical protein